MSRSAPAIVRNPVLGLPSVRQIEQLSPDTKAALRSVLLDLSADARIRADTSWRGHKGPMAVYWRSIAVYAGHLARVLR